MAVMEFEAGFIYCRRGKFPLICNLIWIHAWSNRGPTISSGWRIEK